MADEHKIAAIVHKTYARGQIDGLVIGTTQAAMNLLMGAMDGLSEAGCCNARVARALLNWQKAIEHLKMAIQGPETMVLEGLLADAEEAPQPGPTLKLHPKGAAGGGPINPGDIDLN